jgi:glycosyltransferase involved in cell wall biosynthesis
MFTPEAKWKLVYRNIDSPKFWLRGAARTAFYRQVVMPRVDAVIGISQRTLSEVVNVYQLGVPHIFVPNAVDFDQLRRGVNGTDVRAATDTPADAVVALFIGHLSRQKRPDRFLRVIQRAAREVPNVHGWLLGDGPDREKLETQARELGIEQRIRFLGYQNNVAPYVAACDMYASTSDTEGLPTVVIEAGYLGKPTVALLVGGMDECVRDGETGLLAARGDEQTLVANLVRLARDPRERKRMGERARAWMSEEFAMSRVGEEYLTFFSSLLGGPASRGADHVTGQQPAAFPNEEARSRRRHVRKRVALHSQG